jgi:hypothetical protein
MTRSKDAVTRFWCEADIGSGLSRFDVSAVINCKKFSQDNQYPVHWLTGKAFNEAVTNCLLEDNSAKILMGTFNEFQDMVFHIDSTGSFRIWGIQVLQAHLGVGIERPSHIEGELTDEN